MPLRSFNHKRVLSYSAVHGQIEKAFSVVREQNKKGTKSSSSSFSFNVLFGKTTVVKVKTLKTVISIPIGSRTHYDLLDTRNYGSQLENLSLFSSSVYLALFCINYTQSHYHILTVVDLDVTHTAFLINLVSEYLLVERTSMYYACFGAAVWYRFL